MTARCMRRDGWEALIPDAERAIEATLRRLPPELRAEAERLMVVYRGRPSAALVRDGVASDTMGLFVGEEYADEFASGGYPRQVILFLGNIRDEAAENGNGFATEVRLTYLHELGHYLGLDEGELERRDL